MDYEETDEDSVCRPEEQKTKGTQEGGRQPPQSYRSVTIQTEVPHTQEEKSCLEWSELHTEWIRNRIVKGMNHSGQATDHGALAGNAYSSTTLCRGDILGAEVGDARVVLVSKYKYSGSQLESEDTLSASSR